MAKEEKKVLFTLTGEVPKEGKVQLDLHIGEDGDTTEVFKSIVATAQQMLKNEGITDMFVAVIDQKQKDLLFPKPVEEPVAEG